MRQILDRETRFVLAASPERSAAFKMFSAESSPRDSAKTEERKEWRVLPGIDWYCCGVAGESTY
jgi:hypothetical protein